MADDWVTVQPAKTVDDWQTVTLSKFSASMADQAKGTPVPWYKRFGMGLADIPVGAYQLASKLPSPTGMIGLDTQEMQKGRELAGADADKFARQREADYQAKRAAAGQTGVDWARFGGNVVGSLPLAAMSPVAGGAAAGALTPVTEGNFLTEKAKQVALGAAGGKASEYVGNALATLAEPVAKTVSAAVQKARDAGYVLTPSMISEKAGPIANALAGWGGKIKTQQAASVKNQEVTNRLAAEALGLPADTQLTPQVFSTIRRNAGRAYEEVANSVPAIKTDAVFDKAVSGLGKQNSQAAQFFPRLMNNPEIAALRDDLSSVKSFPPDAALELVKKLRGDAVANLKSIGDPGKHALGLAQREAADEVDALVDRNLGMLGKPGLVEAYQNARKLIAKSYDVEGATNLATGDVKAHGLARLAAKGKPLTDQLKTIADTAEAFPKAMQDTARFGGDEAHSGLDFFGSALAIAHGNPGVAAAIMGRPIARSVVLSDRFQNMLVPPTVQQGAGTNFLARIAPGLPAVRNMLAQGIRRTAPYAGPAAGIAAQGFAGP